MGESQEVSDFYINTLLNYDNRTFHQQFRFDFMFSLMAGQADLNFADHEMGLTDTKTFENALKPFLQMIVLPGGRGYWAKHGPNCRESFYALIEQHLAESESKQEVVA